MKAHHRLAPSCLPQPFVGPGYGATCFFILGSQQQDADLFMINLFNVPDLIQGIVGGWPLGWNDTVSSAVVPVIGLLSVGALAYVGISTTWLSQNVAISAGVIGLIGFPLLFMQSQGIALGEVVQSRYLLPLFALLICAVLMPRKISAPLLINRRAGFAIAISLWFTLNLSWWVNAHRYSVGADAPFLT
jgi:hypothetical protein